MGGSCGRSKADASAQTVFDTPAHLHAAPKTPYGVDVLVSSFEEWVAIQVVAQNMSEGLY
jgi:hypothetical protein